jgi:hypothetical protein
MGIIEAANKWEVSKEENGQSRAACKPYLDSAVKVQKTKLPGLAFSASSFKPPVSNKPP